MRMEQCLRLIQRRFGIAADRFLSDVGYRLRNCGVNVGGVVQRNTFVRDRTKCDMELEELHSGSVFQISEDRGAFAKGCRLDRSVLADVASSLASLIEQRPAILIVNKFGKVEAEGGGLRDVIANAVQSGIPTIIGVPYRNIDQWRAFAGELAREAHLGTQDVAAWLLRCCQDLGIQADAGGSLSAELRLLASRPV